MGGKSSKTTTNTVSEPWSGVQDYLKGAYGQAENLYNKGAPNYYGGKLLAPLSGYTRGALDSMANRAQQGSGVVRAAQGQLTDTLGGKYLEAGNPYFQGAVNAATRPVIDTYNKTIAPGINSDFSAAGRYGSGAHAMASSDAANNLMTQIGDISSQMAYQNYGDERQNQIRGMLFAPEMANQDYIDINALGQAGEGIDAWNQAKIDKDIQKYNYQQSKDWNYLNDYIGLLNGAVGGSTTTTSPVQRPNIFSSVGGGALTGFGVGGIPGALVGGGLGLLGSLF